MANTNISWTDETWSPIVGCSIRSTGCKNCYAMRAAWRMSHNPKTPQYLGTAKLVNGKPVWIGKMSFAEKAFLKPLKTRKPTRFFVNSMGDLFHEDVPDAWIDRVFAVMALCPQHIFQVLTKRADRMREYLNRDDKPLDICCAAESIDNAAVQIPALFTLESYDEDRGAYGVPAVWPLPNVHLGVSVENQPTADERIPLLLDTPAAVRWISAEPLLGPVDVAKWMHDSNCNLICGEKDQSKVCTCTEPREVGLDLVIVGGESGPGARPMHPDWARSIRDQCKAAGVPFHFKQWGAWGPAEHLGEDVDGCQFCCMDDSGQLVMSPDHKWACQDREILFRVGKKAAGRRLDGEEHNGQVE